MSILRTYQELAFFFWVTSLLSVIFLVIGAICSKSKCDPSLHTAGWRWAAPKLHQTNHFSFSHTQKVFDKAYCQGKITPGKKKSDNGDLAIFTEKMCSSLLLLFQSITILMIHANFKRPKRPTNTLHTPVPRGWKFLSDP